MSCGVSPVLCRPPSGPQCWAGQRGWGRGGAATSAPISLSPFVCPLGRAERHRLSNTLQGLSSGQTRVLGCELPPMAWAPLVPGVRPALGQWQEGLALGCFLAPWRVCVGGWGEGEDGSREHSYSCVRLCGSEEPGASSGGRAGIVLEGAQKTERARGSEDPASGCRGRERAHEQPSEAREPGLEMQVFSPH